MTFKTNGNGSDSSSKKIEDKNCRRNIFRATISTANCDYVNVSVWNERRSSEQHTQVQKRSAQRKYSVSATISGIMPIAKATADTTESKCVVYNVSTAHTVEHPSYL